MSSSLNLPHYDDRTEGELAARLKSGHFIVTAELTPPVATDAGALIERAAQLKGLATAVNITDGAGAKAHLSSLVAAALMRESGEIGRASCRERV